MSNEQYQREGKLSIEDCEQIERELPETCDLFRQDPEQARTKLLADWRETIKKDPCGYNSKVFEYLRQLSHKIDPLSRQNRDQQRNSMVRPKAIQAEIDEIEAGEAWKDPWHPDHRKTLTRRIQLLKTKKVPVSHNGNGEVNL